MSERDKPFHIVPHIPAHSRREPQPGDIIPVMDDVMTVKDAIVIAALVIALCPPWFVGVYTIGAWVWESLS